MQNNNEVVMLMVMNTIGLSILYSTFINASWIYTKPHYHPKVSSDSLAFIEGTGLEVVLNTYHLMYDADKIRNVFFSMVGDHAKIV